MEAGTVSRQQVAPEAPPPQYAARTQYGAVPQARTSGKAVGGLVCGIVGLVTAIFVFPPMLFSTLAIALGAVARSEAKRDPLTSGASMGAAAIALGIAGFVVDVVWVVLANTVL